MKSNVLKWYSLVVLFLVNFVMFAQGDESGQAGTLEADDSPINTYVVFLAIAGVVFAAQYFRKHSVVKVK